MRGKRLALTRLAVVDRALQMVGARLKGSHSTASERPIAYRLEPGYNGGADPTAPHCASWSFGNKTATSDCVGLALWASGIDRCQPGYKGSRGEWLNCQALLDDAYGAKVFCAPVRDAEARPGDWLVTGSHMAVIIHPDPEGDHLVVDCSPRHGRHTHAVGVGLPWSEACRVLRPNFYAEV